MSIGGWLKKATTIPTKGPLGGIGRHVLRPVFGENMLDEIGTAGGFLVGGPGGAAVGRAIGNGVHTQDVGKTIRAGAEGYMMGTGAEALGLHGGSMDLVGGFGGHGAATATSAGGGKAGALAAKGIVPASTTGGARGTLSKVGGWIADHPELVLGGITAATGAVQSARDDAARREGVDMLRERQLANAPLEEMMRKMLLGGIPARRSLNDVYADPTNPYYRQVA
jgi:hypothetical protein